MTHHFFYELSLWLWEINLLSSVILQVYSNFSYMIDLRFKYSDQKLRIILSILVKIQMFPKECSPSS